MAKIIAIGSPGAGKSTFSKKLSALTHLPLYQLDLLWHRSDKKEVTRKKFDEKLGKILKEGQWIIDGNYQRTLEWRLKESDTVFLLDYPVDVCLAGAFSRIGIKRDDLPFVEEELDEEFRQKIIDFSNKKLPKIYELLDKYSENKNIIIFKNREEASYYLEKLKK